MGAVDGAVFCTVNGGQQQDQEPAEEKTKEIWFVAPRGVLMHTWTHGEPPARVDRLSLGTASWE